MPEPTCIDCHSTAITRLRFAEQFVCRECGRVWQKPDWQNIEAEIKAWAAENLPMSGIGPNPLTGEVWAVADHAELNLTALAKRLSERRIA